MNSVVKYLKVLLGLLVAVAYHFYSQGRGSELYLQEMSRLSERQARQPIPAPDPSIVIVGIDDEVYEKQAFNRANHAKLVDTLMKARVSAVFLDLIFDEARGPEFDLPLADAIARSGKVVVAGTYGQDQRLLSRPKFYPELDQLVRSGACTMGIINGSNEGNKSQIPLVFLDQRVNEKLSYVNNQGKIEKSESNTWGPGLRLSPSAALLAINQHLTASDIKITEESPWRASQVSIEPYRIEIQPIIAEANDKEEPTLLIYRVPVRFHPPSTGPEGKAGPDRIPVIPYMKVLEEDPSTLKFLEHKVILVGDTTRTRNDLLDTPVGPMKGVEIHANLYDTILRKRITYLPIVGTLFGSLSGLLISALSAITFWSLRRQKSWRPGALIALSSLAIWEVMVAFADSRYYFLPQTQGEAALAITALTAFVIRFSDTRRILRTFLPEDIIHDLLSDREIHQGVIDATVMVTDIRGYTTLSESRTPTQVLELLNDYHTETVALYQRFDGHVLNYQGDAQIIIFGHPRKLKDPALSAVRAAQAASEAVERLRQRWNLPPEQTFMVGAGICSGKVIIADLGGEHREYTVIGELVRKCHKLQSQSQVLSANIILDEETFERCQVKPPVERRENVTIDGLPEPVTVYITDIIEAK